LSGLRIDAEFPFDSGLTTEAGFSAHWRQKISANERLGRRHFFREIGQSTGTM
jgi:hypothetical protein